MLGSITPLGEQGRGNRWWLTAASCTAASALGGLLVGSAAGALGAALRLGGLALTPAAAQSVLGGALVGLAFGGLRAVPLLAAGRTATPDAVRRLHLRVAVLARPADRLIRSSQAGVAAVALLLALPALA